jgi:hypothetical protein
MVAHSTGRWYLSRALCTKRPPAPSMTRAPSSQTGPLYCVSDWPNPAVPKFVAGAYTIWHKAGMSESSIKRETEATVRLRSLHAPPRIRSTQR